MKEYLLSILVASLASALLLHLLPEKSTLKKGVRLLSALLLLSLLLSPLSGAKEALTEFLSGNLWNEESLREGYQQQSDDSILSHSKEYLETLVKEGLIKNFSLREEDLRVHFIMEEGEPKKVLLLLSGKAIWQDSAKLEDFVEDLLGIPASSAID